MAPDWRPTSPDTVLATGRGLSTRLAAMLSRRPTSPGSQHPGLIRKGETK